MKGVWAEFPFYIFPPTFTQVKKLWTYCFFALILLPGLTSCSLYRKVANKTRSNESPTKGGIGKQNKPSVPNAVITTQKLNKKEKNRSNPVLSKNLDQNVELIPSSLFRYSILLNVEVEVLRNHTLYSLIQEWWGSPYKYGGITKRGVDCSGFVQNLAGAVYGFYLSRTAGQQYEQCKKISREELSEGDLVFFNTSRGVSHVGVYLHNDKFVHASTSLGVTISDLKESYWAKRFIGAGRLPNS
jgi:cell wall-associated NlpC family hydrolase